MSVTSKSLKQQQSFYGYSMVCYLKRLGRSQSHSQCQNRYLYELTRMGVTFRKVCYSHSSPSSCLFCNQQKYIQLHQIRKLYIIYLDIVLICKFDIKNTSRLLFCYIIKKAFTTNYHLFKLNAYTYSWYTPWN